MSGGSKVMGVAFIVSSFLEAYDRVREGEDVLEVVGSEIERSRVRADEIKRATKRANARIRGTTRSGRMKP